MSDIKIVSNKELSLLSQQDCVRFALFCAEQVRDSWKGIPECFVAIETTERWLEGKATEEECWKAANAATTAAVRAARATYAANAAYAAYAAYAVAYAASAASSAAYDAVYAANAAYGNPHLIEAQWEYYEELLYFDDIAEKLLLGGVV